MNVVNFTDGADGLAAGVCTIAAVTFAIIALSLDRDEAGILAALTAGAAAGFLWHNFHPATVFMGDSGSNLLGLLLAAVAIQGVLKTAAVVALFFPLVILAVPALDATFVVAKRIKYRRPVYSADRWHFHHRFANIGFSQRQTVLYLYAWTLSLAALALALRFVPYSADSGELNLGWTAVILAFAAVAFAASLYLVVVLEILKFRRFRERQLNEPRRRARCRRSPRSRSRPRSSARWRRGSSRRSAGARFRTGSTWTPWRGAGGRDVTGFAHVAVVPRPRPPPATARQPTQPRPLLLGRVGAAAVELAVARQQVGSVLGQPLEPDVLDLAAQVKRDPAHVNHARLRAQVEQLLDLLGVVVDAGDERGDEDAARDAHSVELGRRLEPGVGVGGARLSWPPRLLVDRRHRTRCAEPPHAPSPSAASTSRSDAAATW